MSVIKVFYAFVIKRPCPYDFSKVKIHRRIPRVLTKGEILEILSNIKNEKHYLMIALLYAAGPRLSEVIAFKTADVDTRKLSLHAKQQTS